MLDGNYECKIRKRITAIVFDSNILIFNAILCRRAQLKQKNVSLSITQIFVIYYIVRKKNVVFIHPNSNNSRHLRCNRTFKLAFFTIQERKKTLRLILKHLFLTNQRAKNF